MQILVKAAVSLAIILVATAIGKKFPSLSGLVAVMPLTGALVLVWVYLDNSGNPEAMQSYAKGALWGILPTIIFYAVALVCFRKRLSLPVALSASFAVWLIGAFLHQRFLK
jgi:uncharacterized membrane protein (GlpM family)